MLHVTDHRELTARDFLIARIARIIPLYWLLSIFACAVYFISPGRVNSSGGTTTVLNSFTLIPTGSKLLIQNGWTLSYEFLFYLIFSTSLNKWCKHRLTFVTSTIFLLSTAGAIFQPINPTLQFLTSKLLLEFQLGIFAYLYINSKFKNSFIDTILIFVGISTLAISSGSPHIENRVMQYGLPYAMLFSGLVSADHIIKKVSTSFPGRIMKLIGDASFSIYLTHPFVLSSIGIILNRLNVKNAPVISVAIMTIASIAVGYVCFSVLERNLIHLARRITPTPNSIRGASPSRT